MVKIYGLKVIITWSFLPLATLRPSVSPGKSVVSSLSSQYSGPFFPPHTISSCYLPAPENCPSSKSIVSLLLLHPCKHTSRIKVKCDKISRSYLLVKNLPAMQGLIPGSGISLEKGMATHSSILAWRIPWTEEPGGLNSMGLQRVGHDWVTNTFTLFHTCARPTFKKKWAPREFGTDMYTLQYFKWITKKDLLYSTWNSAQCYVAG